MGRARLPRLQGLLLPTIGVACALLAGSKSRAEPSPEITVATSTELIEALEPGQRARRIRLRAGRYALAAPLSVPDGVALEGAGVMQLDADGLPTGFVPGTESMLVASEGLAGDVITMGDGASLRGLRIEGPDRAAASGDASAAGNVVMIASRRPGDRLKTYLRDCEIVSHDRVHFNDRGPTGRTIAVITRHRRAGSAWHQGSRVSVSIERSIVRHRLGGNAVFAINFAGGASLELNLERNRIEGHLGVGGGAGRPDRVTGSSATLRSRNNVYAGAEGYFPIGWAIIGGSVAPHESRTEGAESNLVRVESHGDRIEGYRIGIRAMAGRLISGMPGVARSNRAELLLSRLRIRTVGVGAADLSLHGALIEDEPSAPAAGTVARPEGNVLQVEILDSSGSGHRGNVYADSSPPDPPVAAPGQHTNCVVFLGSRARFLDSNTGFDPAPAARLFRTPPIGAADGCRTTTSSTRAAQPSPSPRETARNLGWFLIGSSPGSEFRNPIPCEPSRAPRSIASNAPPVSPSAAWMTARS